LANVSSLATLPLPRKCLAMICCTFIQSRNWFRPSRLISFDVFSRKKAQDSNREVNEAKTGLEMVGSIIPLTDQPQEPILRLLHLQLQHWLERFYKLRRRKYFWFSNATCSVVNSL
jgi:hypothetical protein